MRSAPLCAFSRKRDRKYTRIDIYGTSGNLATNTARFPEVLEKSRKGNGGTKSNNNDQEEINEKR